MTLFCCSISKTSVVKNGTMGFTMVFNKKIVSLFTFIFCFFCTIFIFAEEASLLQAIDSAIIFQLNFNDGTLFPELSLGEVEPLSVKGTAEFLDGPFGKALLLGGQDGITLQYHALQNIDLSRNGALSFWLAPKDWIQAGEASSRPYIRFFNMNSAGAGYFFIQRQGFVNPTEKNGKSGRRGDMFQVGLYAFKDMKNALTGSHNTLNWKNGEWRHFVINWNRSGMTLSINGKSATQKQFSRALNNEDFKENQNKKIHFRIGYGKAKETSLFDELTIYKRNLNEDEIKFLYENNAKLLKP